MTPPSAIPVVPDSNNLCPTQDIVQSQPSLPTVPSPVLISTVPSSTVFPPSPFFSNFTWIPGEFSSQIAPSTAPDTRVTVSRKPRALYLYAGLARKSDVGEVLKRLGWEIDEMDILRDRRHDLSRPTVRGKVLHKIRSNYFSAVVASPPCDTFSRVTFANRLGPQPPVASITSVDSHGCQERSSDVPRLATYWATLPLKLFLRKHSRARVWDVWSSQKTWEQCAEGRGTEFDLQVSGSGRLWKN